MLCERSYDPLSRMLLKGDEGGAKFGGGSVTSNRDSSLTTRRSIHSAIHEPGRRPTRTRAAKFPGSRQRRWCRFSASSPLAASPVPRNGKIDPGDNDPPPPPPKMTQGGNDPLNPPSSPSTASLSGVARCWHSNAYFSLFSSLFFFDPPNRFVQIPRDLS